jgi:hypothetical protein
MATLPSLLETDQPLIEEDGIVSRHPNCERLPLAAEVYILPPHAR